MFLDKITEAIEGGHNVDVIYLDFAKAFDRVPHGRLKLKLKQHGLDGDIWNWINAWLSNR